MNNDLISRKALKEAIKNSFKHNLNGYDALLISEIDEFINNAPTVFSCNACKNMGNERECVDCHDYSNYVHYEERSQGKWIKHIDNLFPEESTEECSICHEEQFLNRGNDDNFCPNCGAKMKGGAE